MAALEAIARKTLKNYDPLLLYGPPVAVPIEKLARRLGLWIEYQCIRKTGSILGEMVYENTLVPLYFRDLKMYELVPVSGKTIILDESLLRCKICGRLRFTCAHEIAHWLIHRELYAGTGRAAAFGNPKKSSEEDPAVERQANSLASLLLMPTAQVKKAYYALPSRTSPILTLAKHFDVSEEAMGYFMRDHNLL
jgi:hypothetical protein